MKKTLLLFLSSALLLPLFSQAEPAEPVYTPCEGFFFPHLYNKALYAPEIRHLTREEMKDVTRELIQDFMDPYPYEGDDTLTEDILRGKCNGIYLSVGRKEIFYTANGFQSLPKDLQVIIFYDGEIIWKRWDAYILSGEEEMALDEKGIPRRVYLGFVDYGTWVSEIKSLPSQIENYARLLNEEPERSMYNPLPNWEYSTFCGQGGSGRRLAGGFPWIKGRVKYKNYNLYPPEMVEEFRDDNFPHLIFFKNTDSKKYGGLVFNSPVGGINSEEIEKVNFIRLTEDLSDRSVIESFRYMGRIADGCTAAAGEYTSEKSKQLAIRNEMLRRSIIKSSQKNNIVPVYR